MDWDKLKVFHAAAEAGSFTHAGERLGLSQSAVSRQVSALEGELSVSLFHRHARGLILTEQGEMLYRTAHEVFMKLEAARTKLTDSRERPNGELKVSTTPGIGVHWLTPRLGEFLDLYPDIHITLITTDEELDLAMREADVAIRLRQPTQPDLIQRKLFSVHFHAYASPDYLKRFGTPRTHEDLDKHRIILLGGNVPAHFSNRRWLVEVGRDGKGPRQPHADHQQRARRVARLPARPGRRDAARLSGGGKRRAGAAVRRSRHARARCLFRLSGRAQSGRAHPGFPRFSGRQRAALAFLIFTAAKKLGSAWRFGMAVMRIIRECGQRIAIRHGSHAALGVAGARGVPRIVKLCCCTGCFLPESPVQQHVPLWKIAGPHTGKLKPGPSRGPVFYWAVLNSATPR